MIAEYHSDPVPAPAGGGGTSYLTSDHLGSTRVVTKADGTVKARYDYLPFGEEVPASLRPAGLGYGGADSIRQKFTQKERDSESGLDYFLARYYSSAQGRFTSPDKPFAGHHQDDPQSWNLFANARNNPLLYVDPLGEDYNIFDKDGNLIGQAKDQKDLEGYVLVSSENEGRLLTFEGGYRAEYFEGDAGKPVQAKDDSGMTPLARGVFLELDRRAAASIKLIDKASQITLTPISIISGSGLFRAGAGLTTLATGAAEASSIRIGARGLAHVLGRHAAGGGRTAGKSLFNGGEGEIVSLIREAGTVARVPQAGGNFARVVDAGRIIGVDRATGAPTSVYTVITNAADELVTAFPGRP
jgi:RHS repeat-associated protein